MTRKWVIGAAAVGILTVLGGGLWFLYSREKAADELLDRAFVLADSVTEYRQIVETTTILSDRALSIQGVYQNDTKNKVFSSSATTTLTIPGTGEQHVFRLDTRTEKDTVSIRYVAVGEQPATIPSNDAWKTFKKDAIPTEFKGVAVPGPILDNLKLFSEHGAYVRLVESIGEDLTFNEPLMRYRLELSGVPADEPGNLAAILERLEGGIADIWVEEESAVIKHIVYSNPPYYSTTTISGANNPLAATDSR